MQITKLLTVNNRMCQTGSRKCAADGIDIDQLHYLNAECPFWVWYYNSICSRRLQTLLLIPVSGCIGGQTLRNEWCFTRTVFETLYMGFCCHSSDSFLTVYCRLAPVTVKGENPLHRFPGSKSTT